MNSDRMSLIFSLKRLVQKLRKLSPSGLLFSFLMGSIIILHAQEGHFFNPILRGGYPDPSICRVGNDFYLVNSSFEYFPGLPIHKSRDLVNWELIGYGLHRQDQCNGKVNLIDVQSNGGIHAPTIRFHEGKFYIITTNVYYNHESGTTDFVNFIITAENPEGPWSDPHILDGAPGIDPDVFFDDDGTAWYTGTHTPPDPNFPGEGEIWLQKLDLRNWKLTGERSFLWRGACGGVWVEGPHIYKKDNRYYLMVAEGGTSFNHAVMIAVSDHIRGPYIPNERNPILTTRNLSYDNWVVSTGHADLVELTDGRWFMVALGVRGELDRNSNMGRETFLVPVTWEREPFEWKQVNYLWPVCAPQTGRVEQIGIMPFPGVAQVLDTLFTDTFDNSCLSPDWNFRRLPLKTTFNLTERRGFLRLYAGINTIRERGRCSLMGIRQKETDFRYETRMEFNPGTDMCEAGISIFQKDDQFYTFTLVNRQGKHWIQLKLAEPATPLQIVAEKELEGYKGDITLILNSSNQSYEFCYSMNHEPESVVFRKTSSEKILSKGYTGAYLGVYSSSNGRITNDFADFDYVKCKFEPVRKF